MYKMTDEGVFFLTIFLIVIAISVIAELPWISVNEKKPSVEHQCIELVGKRDRFEYAICTTRLAGDDDSAVEYIKELKERNERSR